MRILSALSHWWSDRPLRIKGLVVIAVPLIVLLGALVSGYLMEQESRRAYQDVQRVLQIQHDIQQVHTLLAEAATGVRGYLLTAKPNFLDRYRMAENELQHTLARLRQQVRDPYQLRLLASITVLASKKSEGLSELTELGSQAPATTLVPILIANKAVLDELRGHVDAMLVREEELRRDSESIAEQVDRRTMIATGVAAVTGAVGAISVMLLFSTGIVRRVRQLADNAERLARSAPLVPMEAASDELGQLAARMENASALLAKRSAEAEASYQEAERANLAKTAFLSRTSHELRTPLNAILGFAQLLERDVSTPAQRDSVEHILKGGRHLLALINEVLDIARIEAGMLDIVLAPVALDDVLREAVALIGPLAAQRAIRIEAPQGQAGLYVQADHKRLLQVLLNLVSNAVKYNQAGGSVALRVRCDDARIWIEVRDSGPGIAPELQQRLFMPFERLGAERQQVEGTGLGLAVSRQLVRAMGGDITLDSAPGQGSTFAVALPRSTRAGSDRAAAAPHDATAAGRSCTVLYIEDQPSNLALVELLLARRGNVTLLSAPTGAAGVQLVRERQVDLVLLDLHLPDADGREVLAALRALPGRAGLPVVVLSADAMPATMADLTARGASGFLSKPLDVPQFFSTLDRVLS